MTEFKVGDRVKVVSDTYTLANDGLTGVITGGITWPISVQFDDEAGDDIFAARELELIPADKADKADEPGYVDYELRERLIVEAVKISTYEDTPAEIVARARAFEAYILGDTK